MRCPTQEVESDDFLLRGTGLLYYAAKMVLEYSSELGSDHNGSLSKLKILHN